MLVRDVSLGRDEQGTEREAYGAKAAQQLALLSPRAATLNVDNYAFYAVAVAIGSMNGMPHRQNLEPEPKPSQADIAIEKLLSLHAARVVHPIGAFSRLWTWVFNMCDSDTEEWFDRSAFISLWVPFCISTLHGAALASWWKGEFRGPERVK